MPMAPVAVIVQRSMDGKLVYPGVLRLNEPIPFAHPAFGKLPSHSKQRIGRVIGANLHHLAHLFLGHGPGGFR